MKRTQEFSSLGQQLQADNEIIAYIDGLAIVRTNGAICFSLKSQKSIAKLVMWLSRTISLPSRSWIRS